MEVRAAGVDFREQESHGLRVLIAGGSPPTGLEYGTFTVESTDIMAPNQRGDVVRERCLDLAKSNEEDFLFVVLFFFPLAITHCSFFPRSSSKLIVIEFNCGDDRAVWGLQPITADTALEVAHTLHRSPLKEKLLHKVAMWLHGPSPPTLSAQSGHWSNKAPSLPLVELLTQPVSRWDGGGSTRPTSV
ncbi:hypothetical protein Q8A73_003067 [Channa argus]|nr:hypothetical protein Q8A73_003067 [Channa argus]